MYVKTKERHGLGIAKPLGGSWDVDFEDGKTWISGLSLGYAF
jgi:long-chain fatty acid transport protein